MLFLILLDYQVPLSEVDAHLPAHRAFLSRHFEQGHFLLSGRKVPRTGGVILAKAPSQRDLVEWLSEDPFHRQRLARYEIVAWEPTMAAGDVSFESLTPAAQG
jgi:uncharacterized protein YciI